MDEAAALFSDDAVFRSAVPFKPYEGRDQVVKVLRAAERVLGVGVQFPMDSGGVAGLGQSVRERCRQ